jgi:hypothetical protein
VKERGNEIFTITHPLTPSLLFDDWADLFTTVKNLKRGGMRYCKDN